MVLKVNEKKHDCLIELLCLKSIINKINTKGSSIPISEISYRVFSSYWQIVFNKSNSDFEIRDLNEVRSKFISRYGLSMESRVEEIEQMLNYSDDKSLKIMLYGIIKTSLINLSITNKNTISDSIAINQLKSIGLDSANFFKINSNNSIQVAASCTSHFKKDNTFSNLIEDKIELLLSNSVKEILHKNVVSDSDLKSDEKEFDLLSKTEKRMEFHMKLNKNKYHCLEDALEWMNMDMNQYYKIHSLYIDYISIKSLKKIVQELPLVTSAMLIFTAVYRYNDDETSGFWPEFFGGENTYNYNRDVKPVMDCISYMSRQYNISPTDRQYLQKINMAKVFAQIYLPEVSLKKIYSAIYGFYFRNKKYRRFVNKVEFLDNNSYRLDKSGLFFLGKDKIFDDVFNDLVELIEEKANDNSVKINDNLPKRFYLALDDWFVQDKKEIDSGKEEYYISSPNIVFDYLNEVINIHLPIQKSRLYSDEEFGWEVKIDDEKIIIPGRIIRQQSGSYLILEERLQVKHFKRISVEYIFNNKKLGNWEFANINEFIIFDKSGNFLTTDSIKRDRCFLGLHKKHNLIDECIIERYAIDGWKDFIFYELILAEYQETKLYINNEIIIPIEDEPVVERTGFKLLFEDQNTNSIFEGSNIYKHMGYINMVSPYIKRKDVDIVFYDLEGGESKSEYIKSIPINNNRLELVFDESLSSGVYHLVIKYKNKNVYKESFIIDYDTKVSKEYDVSYTNKFNSRRRLMVYKNSEIEILPYDSDTGIKDTEQGYIVEIAKTSVARFIYKRGSNEVVIRNIVRPIKLELLGLEYVVEPGLNDRVKEITKEVLNSNDINLYIRNLDVNYKYLNYNISLIDNVTDNFLTSTKRIKFGDEINWNFNDLKDRIVDFKNITALLDVTDEYNDSIYKTPILEIKDHIKIHDFKKEIVENFIFLSWKEEQNNNRRKISLYNVTLPGDRPLEFNLEDGETHFKIDLDLLRYGLYVPIIEFHKERSLFDQIESSIFFPKREDIRNEFLISSVEREVIGIQHLSTCIWMIYKEEYEDLYKLVNNIDLSETDTLVALSSLIQMKYFVVESETGIKALLTSTYAIIKRLLRKTSKDKVIRIIVESKDLFEKQEIVYLLNIVVAIDKEFNILESTIDSLADFDLVSALCSLENGKGQLSQHIISKSKKGFDSELLASHTIRNYNQIFNNISNEINIINDFWMWLTEHKNRYLLRYEYSKARLFRLYQDENNISTFKVLGRTIDDMVDNIGNGSCFSMPNFPQQWSIDLKFNIEIFNSFNNLINANVQENYKDVLKSAFIAITRLSSYSDEEYFNLIMKCHLSDQKDIFDRYRAYLKLVFI